MIKQNNIKKKQQKEKNLTKDDLKQLQKQSKMKRKENKLIAQQIGQKNVGQVHIEKYTNDFKKLIDVLNTQNLKLNQAIENRGQLEDN